MQANQQRRHHPTNRAPGGNGARECDLGIRNPDQGDTEKHQEVPSGAKELGQLKPDTTIGTQIGQVNIHLVQQVLALPEEVQETYLRTGRLPPGSYLSDLAVVEDEKEADSPG